MYHGSDAISIIHEQVKHSHSVRTIFSAQVAQEFLSAATIVAMHEAHKEKHVNKKVLLLEDPLATSEQQRLQQLGFAVKICNIAFPLHADLMILDHKVFFVSYAERIQAIEIVQPLFVQAQRAVFDNTRDHTA
ncbi:MAG: hypothetical protein H6765_05035 [Candidatus Peribacteria bacterium]|nr:MAG: hypothetical protein H6765_05035 [Candidatus Peribacteria bacterium]